MAEKDLYLWNQERALEVAKSEPFICRVCLEHVPLIPIDAMFRHALQHAQGQERKDIEERVAWFSNEENLRQIDEYARQNKWDSKTVEYAIKHGMLVRVRGKG
jgi:hypothetical protein